jgi:hypothetical protein
MKRISLLGAVLVLASTMTGCVIHPTHIDPLTGCRQGCSIEAIPDGPLDCCFYVKILKCPLFPWNWGQWLCCENGLCDVPPCGPGGCGLGPAYPPLLTGDPCCGDAGGCCSINNYAPTGGCCSTGGYGMPYGGMEYPVAPMTGLGGGGSCCSAPGGMAPAMPTPTFSDPVVPPMAPMAQPPMPMPGALEPTPNPQTYYMPPASLMPPTSMASPIPYVEPMSYVSPTGYTNPAMPRMLPAMQARPIQGAMPVNGAMQYQGQLPVTVAH